MAESICRILEDPALHDALSQRARAASARYDVAECVRQMEALYDEVLAERAR
jgi:glycosyltransferase involved in cell wall biosynthesis